MKGFKYRKGATRWVTLGDKKFYHIEDLMKIYGEDVYWEIHESAKIFSQRYIYEKVDHFLVDEDLSEILFAKNNKKCKAFKIRDCMAIPNGYANNH